MPIRPRTRRPIVPTGAMLALGAAAAALLLTLPGCKTGGPADAAAPPDRPPPTYPEFRQRWNANARHLDRLWARSTVAVRWTDRDGEKHYEQGDGHLQVRDRSSFALSIGKLGEVLLWFGGDDDRYWLLDRVDEPVAMFGSHARLTPDKRSRLGLPVSPLELLVLSGVAPLPPESAAAAVRTGWSPEGAAVAEVVEGSGASWLFAVDPDTWWPVRIERLDPAGRPVVWAELGSYKRVRLAGSADVPRIAGRMRIVHPSTESSMTILLDGDVVDGRGSGKPRSAAFEFDTLVDALGPFDRVIDLDTGAEVTLGAPAATMERPPGSPRVGAVAGELLDPARVPPEGSGEASDRSPGSPREPRASGWLDTQPAEQPEQPGDPP